MKTYPTSRAPHLWDSRNIHSIYTQQFIALVPVLIASLVRFRLDALKLIAGCLLGAVLAKGLSALFFKRKFQTHLFPALLLALLFALILPLKISWQVACFGSWLAVFAGRELAGGLGASALNPIAFAGLWVHSLWAHDSHAKLVAGNFFRVNDFFLNPSPDLLGGASAFALLISTVLFWIFKMKVFDAGLFFLLGIVFAAPLQNFDTTLFLNEGIWLVAFFAANEFSSVPSFSVARKVFGFLSGFLSIAISAAWSNIFAGILLMNALALWLDFVLRPKGSHDNLGLVR